MGTTYYANQPRLKCGEVFAWDCVGELFAIECLLCEEHPLCALSEFAEHMDVWHYDWTAEAHASLPDTTTTAMSDDESSEMPWEEATEVGDIATSEIATSEVGSSETADTEIAETEAADSSETVPAEAEMVDAEAAAETEAAETEAAETEAADSVYASSTAGTERADSLYDSNEFGSEDCDLKAKTVQEWDMEIDAALKNGSEFDAKEVHTNNQQNPTSSPPHDSVTCAHTERFEDKLWFDGVESATNNFHSTDVDNALCAPVVAAQNAFAADGQVQCVQTNIMDLFMQKQVENSVFHSLKTQKLIEIYEKFPQLWHSAHRNALSPDVQAHAYQSISLELSQHGIHLKATAVQRRLDALRKSYRLEKLEELKSLLKGQPYKSSFGFYERMQFLKEHIEPQLCAICNRLCKDATECCTSSIIPIAQTEEAVINSNDISDEEEYKQIMEKINEIVAATERARTSEAGSMRVESEEMHEEVCAPPDHVANETLIGNVPDSRPLNGIERVSNESLIGNVPDARPVNGVERVSNETLIGNVPDVRSPNGSECVPINVHPPNEPECVPLNVHPLNAPDCVSNETLIGNVPDVRSPNGPECVPLNVHPLNVPECVSNETLIANLPDVRSPNGPECVPLNVHPLNVPECVSNESVIANVPDVRPLNAPVGCVGNECECNRQNPPLLTPPTMVTVPIADGMATYSFRPEISNFQNTAPTDAQAAFVPHIMPMMGPQATQTDCGNKVQILEVIQLQPAHNFNAQLQQMTTSAAGYNQTVVMPENSPDRRLDLMHTTDGNMVAEEYESSNGDSGILRDPDDPTDPCDADAPSNESDDKKYTESFARLTTENARTLIKLYEQYPALWNPEHVHFTTRERRRKAWQELTDKFNTKLEKCYTWETVHRKMHDYIKYYRRERQRIEKESGRTRWYFYDDFEFMKDVVNEQLNDAPKVLLNKIQSQIIIDIYSKHPQLWDTSHIEYKRRALRQGLFKKMSEQLSSDYNMMITPLKLKQRIVEFRCTYRMEKERRCNAEDNGQTYRPTYTYYEQLSFLDPHIAPFKCPKCSVQYRTYNEMERHTRREHNENKIPTTTLAVPHTASDKKVASLNNVCHICGLSFTLRRYLVGHLRRHNSQPTHACLTCPRRFYDAATLRIHERAHSKQRPFVCKECGSCYPSGSKLNQHMKRHTNQRDHPCKICGKAFFSGFERDRHVRTHSNVREKVCAICGKDFSVGSSYYAHMLLHADEKRYKCNLCSKEFAQYAGLYKHRRRYHPTEFAKLRATKRGQRNKVSKESQKAEGDVESERQTAPAATIDQPQP